MAGTSKGRFWFQMEEVDQWRGGKLIGTYNHLALQVVYDDRAYEIESVLIFGWPGPGTSEDMIVDEVGDPDREYREIVAHLSAKDRKKIEARIDEYLAGTRADAMAA